MSVDVGGFGIGTLGALTVYLLMLGIALSAALAGFVLGRYRRRSSVAHSIDNRRRLEKDYGRPPDELTTVLEAIDYGIILMDADLRIIIANKAFREMWKIPEAMLAESSSMTELMSHYHHDGLYEIFGEKFDDFVKWREKAAKSGSGSPLEISRPDGRVLIYQCIALPSGDRMLTFYEITEQKKTEELIRHLANHDPLTGLPSLRLAREILATTMALAKRNKWQFSVMYVDLDGFKEVNDAHGHVFGDDLLKKVARRLSASVRESDTVARIGGDEFLVIQNELHSRDDAARIAGNIIRQLSKPFFQDGLTKTIGASIGIAIYPLHGTTVTDIIKTADRTMYAVKKAEKNNFRFADQQADLTPPSS